MPNITAIITAYRRPQNIQPLVSAIRGQTVSPAAIWAWANEPGEEMHNLLAKAKLDRVVTSSDNARFHGRFALALLAPTEFVAIFDDDSIPGNEWFANCLKTMDETPCILGTAGVVLHGEDGLPSLRFYVFCRCFSFKMLGQLYRRSPR
jgi:GT2 family glycosyltransferase